MSRGMHALLIYPPVDIVEDTYRFWLPKHSTSFPLALLRLSTYLKKKGYRVSYLDAFNLTRQMRVTSFQEWRAVLRAGGLVREAPMGGYNPEGRTRAIYRAGLHRDELAQELRRFSGVDEIYISSIFTWAWATTHEVVELCKEIHPKARVVLGGVYPTLCPEKAAESGADEIFVGRMTEIENEWSDLEIAMPQAPDALVIKSTIGCPNCCSYCAVDKLEGRKVQARDLDDTLAEVFAAYERHNLNTVVLWESNPFIRRKDHFDPFLRAIAASGLPFNIEMPEGTTACHLDDDAAVLYKQAGMKKLKLALETTDPDWARRKGRPSHSSHDDMQRAMNALHNCGFNWKNVSGNLLIGQPEQTRTSILRDILSILSAGATVSFLFFTLIPGTKDYDTLADWRKGKALEDLDPLLFPFASPQLTITDLEKLQYYFHDRYLPIERIRASRTDDDLIREMQQLIEDGDYLH